MNGTLRIREELASLFPHASFVKNKSIAVLIPCYNEAATIAAGIEGFRRVLPGASIYVYDNNSTDGTAEVAAAAGALVRREMYQGKGNVVRRMFADIEADVYVLADGDLTYDAAAAGRLVEALVVQNVDIVVGVRIGAEQAFRRGHRFGNRLFNWIVARLFGPGFTDILSGYHRADVQGAQAVPVLRSAVHRARPRIAGDRRPRGRHLCRDRTCAALADRDPGGEHHAAGVPEPVLRHRDRGDRRDPP